MAIKRLSRLPCLFRGKKAYFFSLTVIILLVLVSAYFSSNFSVNSFKRSLINSERIVVVNDFINSVLLDSRTALSVSSYRAFLTIDEDLLRVNGFLGDDFDPLFQELVVNGSFNGVNASLMNFSSINDWVSKVSLVANQLLINVSFYGFNVSAFQRDPWFVIVSLNSSMSVHDSLTNSSWVVPLFVVVKIPISRLFDPVYSVGSRGKYFQHFKKSDFVFSDDLMKHIYNHSYIASTDAPGFINRIKGFLHPDPFGVESLVDVPLMESFGLVFNNSIVDWQYFFDHNPDYPLCHASGFPDWVVIPSSENETYNVSCD